MTIRNVSTIDAILSISSRKEFNIGARVLPLKVLEKCREVKVRNNTLGFQEIWKCRKLHKPLMISATSQKLTQSTPNTFAIYQVSLINTAGS